MVPRHALANVVLQVRRELLVALALDHAQHITDVESGVPDLEVAHLGEFGHALAVPARCRLDRGDALRLA